MKITRSTIDTTVTIVAALILLAALPSAVRDTFETGRVYLFSRQFLEELPQRFTGPGRFRFILQPLLAFLLGMRGGLNDARMGQPPYLYSLLLGGKNRKELLHNGATAHLRAGAPRGGPRGRACSDLHPLLSNACPDQSGDSAHPSRFRRHPANKERRIT
jgi:hypothetical protein